jgi:multiple sugar transport system substrate-binding protein
MTAGMPRQPRLDRRTLSFGVAASLLPAGMAAQQSTPAPTAVPASLAGSTLRLLTWQRPVTGFDPAFETIVREWADHHGVGLTIDWLAMDTMVDAVTNEIDLGSGHDLIDTPQPLPQAEPAMLDHTSLFEEVRATVGEPTAVCAAAPFNPVTGSRWGLTYGWEPAVGLFRKSLWEQAGLPAGPATTDDLVRGGTLIWNERGVQTALGLSTVPVAEITAQTLIWAHAGAVQDAAGQVTLSSSATERALVSMRNLFWHTTTPVVQEWEADFDVIDFMRQGFGSYTIGGVHHLRWIASQSADIAADLYLAPPLAGPEIPARAMPVTLPTLMIPRWNPNPGPAAALVREIVERSSDLLMASQLAYLPGFPATIPNLFTGSGPLRNDPFDEVDPGRLLPLMQAETWTVGAGWPGPWNPMVEAGHRQGLLTRMLANAATETLPDVDAMNLTADAFTLLAEPWREAGLMQPGTNNGVG